MGGRRRGADLVGSAGRCPVGGRQRGVDLVSTSRAVGGRRHGARAVGGRQQGRSGVGRVVRGRRVLEADLCCS